MARVKACDLRRVIDQVAQHQPAHTYPPAIYGVHFDCDGHFLHAVATDRFTMGVARALLEDSGDEKWSHTLAVPAVKALRQWAEDLAWQTVVTITVAGEGAGAELTFTAEGTSLTAKAIPEPFVKWRSILAGVINLKPDGPILGVNSEFGPRWAAADSYLTTWHLGPRTPTIYVGDGFIGLQMPAKPGDSAPSHAALIHTWAGTVASAEPVDAAEELGDPAKSKPSRDITQFLLRTAVVADRTAFDAPERHPTFYAAADTVGAAWAACRLLEALRRVSPLTADKTLLAIDDELEGGEFGELAYESAREAGYDPDEWIEAYRKWLAERPAATQPQTEPEAGAQARPEEPGARP